MPLTWSFAAEADAGDFLSFHCWDGNDDQPWVEEAENYLRYWVLDDAQHVIACSDEDDELIAVAAFDERTVAVPLVNPLDHDGWHLQVVAIRLGHQGRHVSDDVFRCVFDAMRTVDSTRVLVTAHVHVEHQASIRACRRAGLDILFPKDDEYWVLLGEVPG